MFKLIGTNVVISKGFDGAPALKYSDDGKSVRFRIGKKVYDTRAENNTRWVNITLKAFGDVCERIKKMKLKDGSFVNFEGRYDEDVWEDQNTHEKKSMPVVILDDIEYASSGGGNSQNNNSSGQPQNGGNTPPAQTSNDGNPAQQSANQGGDNFTGYAAFGTGDYFDEN